MSLSLCRRQQLITTAWRLNARRTFSTANPTDAASSSVTANSESASTHFKITLRRSGISMGKKIQGTLLALGFHRRHQTVYHPHTPDIAGKILRVKELVDVENVPPQLVFTSHEQRQMRKPEDGFEVVGSRKANFMNI